MKYIQGKENLKRKKEKEQKFIEKIQPKGGITFKDVKYITSGNGYEACIHIYEFPKTGLKDFWLSSICSLKDAVVTVDISTDNIDEAKKNLNKSIKEQNFRYNQAKDFEELYDAKERMDALIKLHSELASLNEVVKLAHIRIFVADTSWVMLEKKVKDVMTQLESDGFLSTIYLNECENEWKSIYRSYTSQSKELYFPYGQPLTAGTLGAGNPFHFSSLEDPYGTFLGKTLSGGNVIFDEFHKTVERLYYNFLAIGEMGTGKSTLLKKIFKRNAVLGNYVRAFDVKGEFIKLTKTLGGKVINGDGSEGILNPLEILKSGEGERNKNNKQVSFLRNEAVSFSRNISKVITIYKFLTGGQASSQELDEFGELLRLLYKKFGFEVKNGEALSQITGLPAESYPIFSNLIELIDEIVSSKSKGMFNDIEQALVIEELKLLKNIRRTVSKLVNTYGHIFNGHTSIKNISDEQIITFDISTLKSLSPEIFDAQIFNLISLCWDNCVSNGKIMQELYREGKFEFEDIVRFLILIDESHRWLNAKKPFALELILQYMREARQYFAGIGLATQTIREYVPEGTTEKELDRMKSIFELTQYKFIFRQQADLKPLLEKAFSGVLTFRQIENIPDFEQGHNILSIASDQNIEFDVYLTDEEEAIFTGGV